MNAWLKKAGLLLVIISLAVGLLSSEINAQTKQPPNKSDPSCPATKETCGEGSGSSTTKIKNACADAKREAREQCEGKNPTKSECQRYCEAGDCEVKSIKCDKCSLVSIGYDTDEKQFVCTYKCCGNCSCKGGKKKTSKSSSEQEMRYSPWQGYIERVRNYFSRLA